VSFAAAARGRKDPGKSGRTVYSESLLAARAYGWAPLFSLRDADTRFIEAPQAELYDERRDPAESRNLAAGSPTAVREWRERLLQAWKASVHGGKDARAPMTDEERERLASLGYLSGGSSPPGAAEAKGLRERARRAGRPSGRIPRARLEASPIPSPGWRFIWLCSTSRS
jgi:hypothetical protein